MMSVNWLVKKIWKSEYALAPMIAADQFKTYAELSARLEKVLNTPASVAEEDSAPWKAPEQAKSMEAKSLPSKKSSHEEEEDDTLAMFEKLARD